MHAPPVLEEEYLKTGEEEEEEEGARSVARACRCGKGALIAISRLGSTFCVKPLLGAIQSVPSIFEGTWSCIAIRLVLTWTKSFM